MIKNVSYESFKKDYNYKPPLDSLCISIMNSDDNLNRYFDLNSRWKSTERYIFDDIIVQEDGYSLFNESHSNSILEFVLDQNLDLKSFNDLIIHCTAGVSRSAAISLFFNQLKHKMLITDLDRFGYSCYNRHVFNVLLNTYNEIAEKRSLPYYHEKVLE